MKLETAMALATALAWCEAEDRHRLGGFGGFGGTSSDTVNPATAHTATMMQNSSQSVGDSGLVSAESIEAVSIYDNGPGPLLVATDTPASQ